MPIIRKLIDLGNSKVVSLPKTWLEFYEKESGEKITFVAMEVNKKLTIVPYIQRETRSKADASKEASNHE